MANINVKFNNKEYLLSCDDGQEENLVELASYLDSKFRELMSLFNLKTLFDIVSNFLRTLSNFFSFSW